jgi:putative membrane protein
VSAPTPTLIGSDGTAPSSITNQRIVNLKMTTPIGRNTIMLRMLIITAALAAPLALPATAESPQNPTTTNASQEHKLKGNLFNERQAREHLSRLGYTGISDLSKDENGTWRGTATKNGKMQQVAVDVKGGPTQ